jgi:hypothetical protein
MTDSFDISKFKFSDQRKDLVFMARTAETAERYDGKLGLDALVAATCWFV